MAEPNIYFDLTQEFNARAPCVVLGSGQAVVHYRIAIMSKDGDWIIRETESACAQVRDVLARRGARYRPGAPLDPRWLAGGWSSHLEFTDPRGRRVRCDFFSRPPRVDRSSVERTLEAAGRSGDLPVIGVEDLIRMKQTQRAKDYPALAALARLLPPERELALTTDPDRVLELAAGHGEGSRRPCVVAARQGRGRREVVLALAEEIDELQLADRRRLERFERASADYRAAFRRLPDQALCLPQGHETICRLALEHLPRTIESE